MSNRSPIDRRTLVSAGLLAAVAACGPGQTAPPATAQGASGAPAPARRARELRMVTTWPKNFPGLGTAAERTAQKISELTGGELSIKVYGAGDVVPAFESFDAVSSGAADMYHGVEYYWQGKSSAFTFFTAVPMGMTTAEMLGWIEHGGGQDMWERLSGQFGLIAFAAGTTGHQMGGWFKREINSLEDFKGLKMRIPGLGGDVVRGLGGAAVNLPGAEIFTALQQGALDATEWVGPWNDLAFGLHRVANYYYGPGFHEPGSLLSLGINRAVWDSLPPEHQRAIRAACAWATYDSIGEFAYQNARALETLQSQHGVQLRSFPTDVWARVAVLSEEVTAAAGEGDRLVQEIYQSYMQARRWARSLASVTDGPYLSIRGAEAPSPASSATPGPTP